MNNLYWNTKGKYQEKAEKLIELFPSIDLKHEQNKHLSKLKLALIVYRDLYNNNLINMFYSWYLVYKTPIYTARKGLGLDGCVKSALKLEKELDALILKAYNEQRKLGRV